MRLRHILRRLGHTPMFTAIAALTLAIGIGADTAIFSVINGVLIKPLPYERPDQLIDLTLAAPGVNLPEADNAPFLYFTYRDHARAFQSAGVYQLTTQTVTGLAEPEEAEVLNLTHEVLPILGVPPAIGRWFSDKDATPGAPLTAILLDGWWHSRFGGDRNVIGKQILVNGAQREIIGVMPPDFRFLDRNVAFALPLQLDRNKVFLGQFNYPGIARLKPGATIQQASADVARMIPIALHAFPPQAGLTTKDFEDVRLAPKFQSLKQLLVGDIGKTLWVVMGTIGMVLLIACANVANLLLVRAEGRQQELAIRAALGASRRDIARELIGESVALGALGSICGLGIAYGAIRVLLALAPAQLPRLNEIGIDAAAVAFTLAIGLGTGLLFGLIPVLKYAVPRIAHSLRGGGRTASQSRERHRARKTLVVVQVALALVLLVGAGLMIRTFLALRHVDPGFDPHGALTLRLSIPDAQVKDPTAAIQLEQAIVEKIRAIPGVTSAGISTIIPTEPAGSLQVYARDKTYDKVPPLRWTKFVSPGFLETIGTRLIVGRDFTWTDTLERRTVALVSENLARAFWGDPRLAIGKEIRENPSGLWREVVGVVQDVHDDGLQAKAPETAYYPLLMNNYNSRPVQVRRVAWYVVRSPRAGSQALLSEVQQAVWSLNPNLPLARVRTLDAIYNRSLARTSFTLVMLGIAGAMALLIGLVGIYGVLSYTVSQRRREIGIRMALGARDPQLARMFIGHGIALAAIGVVFGLAGSFAVTRVLSTLLFGVTAFDPLTLAGASLVLILAAGLASYGPALRAMSVDPVEALRSE
jgi:predicted permease